MGKYLLLLAVALLLIGLVRASLRRRRGQAEKPSAKGGAEAEKMVRCAECGVHLPRGESLVVRGQFYCCADHQRRHDPGQ